MTRKEEILKEMEALKYEASMMKNREQAVKLMLNSIYGAFGNEYFHFYNVNIAESITLQGKDAILSTEKVLNGYFSRAWHLDKPLHEKMGITNVRPVMTSVVIYMDTDSCYVSFAEVLKSCEGWTGNVKDFILGLYEHRLEDFLGNKMLQYADVYGADNYLSFELETVADNGVWLAKKSYIQNITWKDGKNFDPLDKISIKGFAAIQSSTPAFCRLQLNHLLKLMLSSDDFDIAALIQELKRIKKEFMLADMEQISINVRANNLQKYIVQDENKLEFLPKAQAHIKGVGLHNFLLTRSKYKGKYSMISNGEKIRMYYTTNQTAGMEAFSYRPGYYPQEFALDCDRELQFEKTIIDNINRIIIATDRKPLTRNLIYTKSLF